jgi:hypothetical protein
MEKQIALVTGGNKGLGKEIVRQLAKRGMTVYFGSRDAGRGEDAARNLVDEGLDVIPLRLDVTSLNGIRRRSLRCGQTQVSTSDRFCRKYPLVRATLFFSRSHSALILRDYGDRGGIFGSGISSAPSRVCL